MDMAHEDSIAEGYATVIQELAEAGLPFIGLVNNVRKLVRYHLGYQWGMFTTPDSSVCVSCREQAGISSRASWSARHRHLSDLLALMRSGTRFPITLTPPL